MNENCLEYCPRIKARSDAVDDAVETAASSDPAHAKKYAEHAAAITQAGQAYLDAVLDSLECPNPIEIPANMQTGSPGKAACALVGYFCGIQVTHSAQTTPQI